MNFSMWLALAAVCAVGAMSPGPSLAVVIRHTVTGSRGHGIASGLAHATGIGVYALLSSFGLAVLITGSPGLYQVLALAGAGYLLWLGVAALRHDGGVEAPTAMTASGPVSAAARDGFAISLLNPKVAIFFLALFSQFVQPGMGLWSHILMAVIAMSIDASWYVLVAVVLSHSNVLQLLRRNGHWLDRATGTVLIALALLTVIEVLS